MKIKNHITNKFGFTCKLFSATLVLLILIGTSTTALIGIANASGNKISFVRDIPSTADNYGGTLDFLGISPVTGDIYTLGYTSGTSSAQELIKEYTSSDQYIGDIDVPLNGLTNDLFGSGNQVAFDTEGNMYVMITSGSGSESVYVYNQANNLINSWPVNDSNNYWYSSIAINSSNDVFITTGSPDYDIQEDDTSGNFIKSIGSSQLSTTTSVGMVTDSSGNIYVVNGLNIYIFDSSGNYLRQFTDSNLTAAGYEPYSITVVGSKVYVSWTNDNNTNKTDIASYDSDGNFLANIGSYGVSTGQYLLAGQLEHDDEGNIYVYDISSDDIEEFSSNGSFVKNLQGGTGQLTFPAGVQVAKNGDVYVESFLQSGVAVYSPQGTFLKRIYLSVNGHYFYFPALFLGAYIQLDSNGNLYATTLGGTRVLEFNSNGTYLKSFSVENGYQAIYNGVAINGHDNLYVAEYDYSNSSNQIQEFNSSGNLVSTITNSNMNFAFNDDAIYSPIVVNNAGDIYTYNPNTSTIYELNGSGNLIRNLGSEGTGKGQFSGDSIVGMALGPDGSLYVGNAFTNSLQKFDPSGNYVESFGSEGTGDGQFGYVGPFGIAISSTGLIYMTDPLGSRVIVAQDSADLPNKPPKPPTSRQPISQPPTSQLPTKKPKPTSSTKPPTKHIVKSPILLTTPSKPVSTAKSGVAKTITALFKWVPTPVIAAFPYILLILLAAIAIRSFHQFKQESRQARLLKKHLDTQRLIDEEKKSFTDLAAHYLRTPLTLLTSSFELLGSTSPEARLNLLPQAQPTLNDLKQHVEGILQEASQPNDESILLGGNLS